MFNQVNESSEVKSNNNHVDLNCYLLSSSYRQSTLLCHMYLLVTSFPHTSIPDPDSVDTNVK